MTNKIDYNKLRGGYYTPRPIADFLTNWAIQTRNSNILEPSCGDGVFVESASERLRSLGLNGNRVANQVSAVELDPKEAGKIVPKLNQDNLNLPDDFININDFFTYAKNELIGHRQFDAVVGNPPFIRYQSFVEEYRQLAFEIMRDNGLNPNKLTNIWVPFLIASSSLLNQDGRLGMVIPAELFQVKYAGETRQYLTDNFSRIFIITFKKLVFPKIQQEVVLLLAEKNGHAATTIGTIEVSDIAELNSLDIENDPNIEAKEMMHTTDKWTYYFLNRDDIRFLKEIRDAYNVPLSGDHIDVDVGVVTGQNKFFDLPHSKVEEKRLANHVQRIVTRSAHLSGINFDNTDWETNNGRDYPMYLFKPPKIAYIQQSQAVRDYLEHGVEKEYNTGYKCSIRKQWFIVPSVWVPDAFMLRQVHKYPKLIVNNAGATCTDTIHRVRIIGDLDRNLLSAGFLNSLTFAFAEVIGRSYGGGVLTFEPSECEILPIPTNGIERLDFDQICQLIRRNDIKGVLDITDRILLVEGLGMPEEDARRLRNVWKTLSDRRVNRKHSQGSFSWGRTKLTT